MGISTSNPDECFGTSLWGFGPWSFEGTPLELNQWYLTEHPELSAPLTEGDWGTLVNTGVLITAWVGPGPNTIQAADLSPSWVLAQVSMQSGYPVPVGFCPPHPTGSGYGGVAYNGSVGGGTGYGLSSFGAVWHEAPPMPITGGYGGDPYGYGIFGSFDTDPPSLASAVSLNGYEIEVFFNEEMDTTDPELLDPANYTLTPQGSTGANATVLSVRIETVGSIDLAGGDSYAGVTSVVLVHTGTTQGGTYVVSATGISDVSGNLLTGATVSLLTKGSAPIHVVTPVGGGKLLLTFSHDLLSVPNYHGGAVETVLSTSSYAFTSTPEYPIALTVQGVTHPYNGNARHVLLDVVGQTSLSYTSLVGPASVVDFQAPALPDSLDNGSYGADGGVSYTLTPSGSNLSVNQSGGYGFGRISFEDDSGRLVSGSTFETSVTFNATGSFTKPVGFVVDGILSHQIYDGAVEFGVFLGWDGGLNLPRLVVNLGSGGGSTQVFNLYDWTTGEHTLTMARNQKAGTVTVLWDGNPIFSGALVNLFPPATIWHVGTRTRTANSVPVPTITGLKIRRIVTTSSSTVFSNAWNYIHESVGSSFTGSVANTKNTVHVARGPLVKGWGDATPATAADVAVLVNDVEVDVRSVNPYTGQITTTIPIPLMPPGMSDVKVDYQWMSNPTMTLAGLNTEGLVLNKYDCTHGHHLPAAHGDQVQDSTHPKGAPDTHRFPMGIVLGPQYRPQPLLIGHRYLGFERGYSATLNSPNTLILNQHPNRPIQKGFEYRPQGTTATFEGLVRPTADNPPWHLVGTDNGGIETNAAGATGIYRIVDSSIGSYNPDNPQAAFYWKDVNLNFPSSMYLVGRFNIEDSDTLIPDGVFTGVGMGVHDGAHLYLMGCLRVNGVEHVAMLLDANKPARYESWQIGPQAQMALTSQTVAVVQSSQVPADLKAGRRFQIFHGDGDLNAAHPQSGIYTLASAVYQTNGSVTLTVVEPFPAHWDTFGNKFPIAVFETLWSTPEVSTTFRLVVDFNQKLAALSSAGATTSTITVLDGAVVQLPQPAETSLLLPSAQDVQNGQVFFGSMSREGASTSRWTFFRYGVVPDVTSISGHEIVVAAEMGTKPEHDPNHEWLLLGDFGYSEVDSSGEVLLLKQTSADEGRNFQFGYARNETWFVPDSYLDITSRFKVESGSGVQDAQIVFNDTSREVRLGTLVWREEFAPVRTNKTDHDDYRFLTRARNVSFKGLQTPSDQDGWAELTYTGFAEASKDIQEGVLVVTQGGVERFVAQGTLLDNGLRYDDPLGRVLEARFAVSEYTAAADGFTGIRLLGNFGASPSRFVGLHLYAGVTPGVRLVTNRTNGNDLVVNMAFDWTDGRMHTYRVVMDAVGGVLTVYLDDVLQLPTRAATEFEGGGSSLTCTFGQFGQDGSGIADPAITSTVEWHSASLQGLFRESTVRRTLGVWLGGDPDDINNWEIPRLDSTTAPNSALIGPSVVTMDWRDWVEVRMLRDPTWGVTVFRPDLPLPSYYTPENGNTPGSGFATELVEPSAGWINVEYRHLPRVDSTFGRVEFGSLRRDNVTQQRWERVRYRLFKAKTDDLRMPEGMVLNRYNVITSGEIVEDKGHETVVVQTLDDRRVTLLPTHLYADRIWKIVEGNTVYTSDMFDFRKESQLVTLKSDDSGVPRSFGTVVVGSGGRFAQRSADFHTGSVDLSGVAVGHILKVYFGESAGSYVIKSVDIANQKITTQNAFPTSSLSGGETWSVSRPQVPVTVVFVPGKPVTNTYLLNQPLLDGITKLNEGTPPVPKSQVAGGVRQVVSGSQTNNINDTLNWDPEFVLNDPFKVVEFVGNADALYEQMEFLEVTNGGEEGLLSFPCEATGLSDSPGFLDTTQGDPIYEVGGEGTPHGGAGDNANLTETGQFVGFPSGGHLLYFAGTSFWEGVGAMTSTQDSRVVHAVNDGGGMPGAYFFASGGNYHGPSIGGGHRNPLGGTLGPGTTISYPTYPSVSQAQGGGKIYRRTEWLMRFREMAVSVDDEGVVTSQALNEDFAAQFDQMDDLAPLRPSSWVVNPSGPPSLNGTGSAYARLSGSEDYSHYGPWGGMKALSAEQDSGLLEVLEAPLTVGTTVSLVLPGPVTLVFTASAVPVGVTQFAAAPTPGVALAAVINAHPVASLWVTATAGLNLGAKESVRIRSLAPVTSSSEIHLSTSHIARIRTSHLTPSGLLTGGSKIQQSSLLAGGGATLNGSGVHVPNAGMVALGGSALPTGVEQEFILVSA